MSTCSDDGLVSLTNDLAIPRLTNRFDMQMKSLREKHIPLLGVTDVTTTLPRRYHNVTTTLPRRYHNVTTTLPQRYHDVTTTLPQRYHNVTTTLPQRYHNIQLSRVTMMYPTLITYCLEFIW
eukprot:1374024-Amorphochlora_amoeboformis.AAC.1